MSPRRRHQGRQIMAPCSWKRSGQAVSVNPAPGSEIGMAPLRADLGVFMARAQRLGLRDGGALRVFQSCAFMSGIELSQQLEYRVQGQLALNRLDACRVQNTRANRRGRRQHFAGRHPHPGFGGPCACVARRRRAASARRLQWLMGWDRCVSFASTDLREARPFSYAASPKSSFTNEISPGTPGAMS